MLSVYYSTNKIVGCDHMFLVFNCIITQNWEFQPINVIKSVEQFNSIRFVWHYKTNTYSEKS